jgi:hypothetical protein
MYEQGPKITREIARQIRHDERPNRILAAQYGVDKSLVSRIKTGKLWRDPAPH